MTTRLGHSIVFAFSHSDRGGNPSCVIGTTGNNDESCHQYIELAKRHMCEVTHIHFTGRSDFADIRFYVASGQIEFCGHGLIAAAAWAFRNGHASDAIQLNFHTGSVQAFIADDGRRAGFVETAGEIVEVPVDQQRLDQLRSVLGLHNLRLDEVRLWRGGRIRHKALIRLHAAEALANIRLNALDRDYLCGELGVTGIYPYAITGPENIISRHFPLRAADSEDVATGGIAATMAYHLTPDAPAKLLIRQGGPNCDSAKICVEPFANNWRISGECRFANDLLSRENVPDS